MNYIRTKDGLYESEKVSHDDKYVYKYEVRPIWCVNQDQKEIIKQADTIEELCDEFVVVANGFPFRFIRPLCQELYDRFNKMNLIIEEIYGCIKTDKGLIYVAKMNDKGELVLL